LAVILPGTELCLVVLDPSTESVVVAKSGSRRVLKKSSVKKGRSVESKKSSVKNESAVVEGIGSKSKV
jgi:hypothetical protein